MKVILDLSSATANAAVVVTKGAWQYTWRKCTCTNRWGTYKAHSNHQLWSQQPNTQKSPNYCHDNHKSSSFSQLFWSRQLLYKKFMCYVHRNQSRFLSVYMEVVEQEKILPNFQIIIRHFEWVMMDFTIFVYCVF